MLFGHGSDIYKHKGKIVADFSSNVWYKGLPNGLTEKLTKSIQELVHYPEPDAGALANKLAKLHKLNKENVLVTNGASEAFYLLAQHFYKNESVILTPSFAEYEDACTANNHKINFISNESIDFYSKLKPNSIVWLGNPNNPDGKLFSAENLKLWLERNKKVTFIVDEAYGELCYGFESLIRYVNEFPNLIIVKSLTKAFSIPGLRLGYVLANETRIENLHKLKIPWSVNSLAIEAGCFITDNYAKLLPNLDEVIEESMKFQKELSQIPAVKVAPSNCNYCLVEMQNSKADELKSFLIEKHGFLIRDASNFRGLANKHIRLAIQDEVKNQKLINAINDFINHG